MKKLILFFQFSLAVFMGFSQTHSITLTFTGKDSQTGNKLDLQSVFIRNESVGCDTTIFGASPSLILTYSLGLNEIKFEVPASFTLMPNILNPFNGSTNVYLKHAKNGILNFSFSTSPGKKISDYSKVFPVGIHKFEIACSQPGLLILSVSDGTTSKSIKLINTADGKTINGIRYVGPGDQTIVTSYKSTKTSGFLYHRGDSLLFRGSADGCPYVILTDTPLQSTSYTFQMVQFSIGAYSKLKPVADDAGWWFLAQETSSDELCAPTRGPDWDDGGKWRNMYRHTWTNDDEGVNRMWSAFWNGITSCNQELDTINELPQNPSLLSKIKEIQVLRSYYYYLLIDNYGDAPYLTSAKNAPAMPFKIKRAAIFDSLVSTIKSALPQLKKQDLKYMATKYMGFALLAKLYLNAEIYTGTAHWDDAKIYCDSVIAGPYNMESDFLAPFKTNNQDSKEIIFSIPYDENNFQGFRLHMRTLHFQHNLRFYMPVGPWNGFAIVPTFFDTYELTDKRREGYNFFGL